MEGKLVAERLGIQAGIWQDHPPQACLVEGPLPKARRARGYLYLLIEAPHGQAPAESLYEELWSRICGAYYGLTGSITRGLRAALLEANVWLLERNLHAAQEQQTTVGLNAVVIREGDVYIGQLGPALVCHVHQGDLVRFPPDSIWLRSLSPSTFDLDREPPAGWRREVEPNLYHTTLAEGDVLILATTSLARLASPAEIVQAATLVGASSPRDNLEALAQGQDLSAIVITWAAEGSSVPLRAARPVSKPVPSPSMPLPPSAAQPPAPEEVSPPLEEAAEEAAPAAPPPVAEPAVTAPSFPAAEEPPEAEPTIPAVPLEMEEAISRPPLVDLDQLRRGLDQGMERMRQSTGDLLERILPEGAPPRPTVSPEPAPPISLSGRALLAVALAIPVVMLAIVISTRLQYDRTRQTQFRNIQQVAQQRYDAAMNMTEATYMRQALYEAREAVEEGLAIAPDDELLNSLARRIRNKLDDLDRVARLFHLWQLAILTDDPTSPTDSSRIVVQNRDVFILNRGSDRIYYYLLNNAGDALQPLDRDPVLLKKGDMKGGIIVGDLVDIAWLAEGGERTLSTFVALERSGLLLVYDPQRRFDVFPVADSDTWLKPQAIGGYFGNLYVLDPLLNRLLKYVPVDNAYTSPPSDYISPAVDVDLTGAVDLAIDGNMYILMADGRVLKFYRGEPQPFPMYGLPGAMRSPTSIFVSGPQKPEAPGYVYVADAGNNRILQFDKNGNFLRQFQDKPGENRFQNLRGLYVDEERGRMLLLSGRTLWMGDIPPLTNP